MLVYLSFPVGIFWVSNQASYFQRHVVERKVGEGPGGGGEGGPGHLGVSPWGGGGVAPEGWPQTPGSPLFGCPHPSPTEPALFFQREIFPPDDPDRVRDPDMSPTCPQCVPPSVPNVPSIPSVFPLPGVGWW